ncbi:hypothetical protein [Crocosphaera sp. XPORK-15E]|uniref:hypothetical protein n=1 Tax=Crocosphaera sp. XPORK-15E TaxID=3110247 RepID=UPI002B1F1CA7|nr:hypothetical protein [Crocosphaera sp. XPORK-15E]MEA5535258.1 hypothetical protein [Crocosphaera sp. XPORK-15E]
MKDKLTWEQIAETIQERTLKTTNLNVKNTKVLRAEILKCLTQAHDEGILVTKLHEIHPLLKLKKSENKGQVWEILGGDKNFKRIKDQEKFGYFERNDQAWFDFAITIYQKSKDLAEIIGFDFEIRFPNDHSPKFIRFDLNLPSHNNEIKGLRFHLHPGNDDIMLHSPPMSPLEILHLFLYGFKTSRKPRSS